MADTKAVVELTKRDLIGESRWKSMYELQHVVIIRLRKQLDEDKSHMLHRLLGALLLPELTKAEREAILDKKIEEICLSVNKQNK